MTIIRKTPCFSCVGTIRDPASGNDVRCAVSPLGKCLWYAPFDENRSRLESFVPCTPEEIAAWWATCGGAGEKPCGGASGGCAAF